MTGPVVVGNLPQRFSGLEALAEDLRTAHRFLTLLAARPSVDAPNEEDLVAFALWNAAVVAYGRCFNSGRHRGLVETVAVPAEAQELHRWVLDLRNDYVAHLGRTTDLQRDTAFVDMERSDEGVALRIGTAWARAAHPERSQIERLRDLSARMAELFTDAAQAAGVELLNAIGQRHSLHDLERAAASNTPIRMDR